MYVENYHIRGSRIKNVSQICSSGMQWPTRLIVEISDVKICLCKRCDMSEQKSLVLYPLYVDVAPPTRVIYLGRLNHGAQCAPYIGRESPSTFPQPVKDEESLWKLSAAFDKSFW